jgi:hypothetical protein
MAAAAPGAPDPADRADPAERADPAGQDRPTGPEPAVVELDVGGLPVGLRSVAALSRLRLAARRTGHAVRLCGAAPELRALLERAGLGGEFEWEAEEREDPLGVQE